MLVTLRGQKVNYLINVSLHLACLSLCFFICHSQLLQSRQVLEVFSGDFLITSTQQKKYSS